MVFFRRIFLILAVLVGTNLSAQSFDHLFRDFDASKYSRAELRFLQLGLALEGDYNGLLDGAWGKISNKAISRFSAREFEARPYEIHAALLAFTTADFLEQGNWEIHYFDALGLSFLIPFQNLVEGGHTEKMLNYEHPSSSLKYSLAWGDKDWTQGLHNYAESVHTKSSAAYTVRKTGTAITSAIKADGTTLYVRSRFLNGEWNTLLISANQHDAPLLAAVAASISTEKHAELFVPRGGYLFSVAQNTTELLEALDEEGYGEVPPPSEPTMASEQSTGTGFYVSDSGHVLTNAHVVEGCDSIRVNGVPAKVAATSNNFDLAILEAPAIAADRVASFEASSAQLNQDVTVVGYPLAGILGGINVTRGAVSSMKGLGGDEATMQITAPVQPGNSGGPVLSQTGNVLGVVVSKLDAQYMADAIGDIPQNINFAIRGYAAKVFLELNGVSPKISDNQEPFTAIQLAARARDFTTFIECNSL